MTGWDHDNDDAGSLPDLVAAVDQVLASAILSLSPGQVRAQIAAVTRQANRLHARYLDLVAASAAHDAGAHDAGAGRHTGATQQYLQATLKIRPARARADIRAAALLDRDTGDLRELGHALAEGTASAEHVRVACRAIIRIPHHFVSSRRQDLSLALTEHATTWAPKTPNTWPTTCSPSWTPSAPTGTTRPPWTAAPSPPPPTPPAW